MGQVLDGPANTYRKLQFLAGISHLKNETIDFTKNKKQFGTIVESWSKEQSFLNAATSMVKQARTFDGSARNFGSLGNMIAKSVVANFDNYKKSKKDVISFLFTFTYKQWKDLKAYNCVFAALADKSDVLTNIDSFEILRGLSEVSLQKPDLEEFALDKFLKSRAAMANNLSSKRLI